MTNHAHPSPARRTPVWTIVLLVVGAVCTAVGAAVLVSGLAAAGALGAQRDGGYLSTPPGLFATNTAAITTPRLGGFTSAPVDAERSFDVGRVRVTAESARPLFVGVGPRPDVERFLAGVRHDEVARVRYDPFGVDYRRIPGSSATATDPTSRSFWTDSTVGTGRQSITWRVQAGDWAVVVMNADGSPGVTATMTVGARTDLLAPVTGTLLVIAAVLLVVGIPLTLVGVVGIGGSLPDSVRPGGTRWPDRTVSPPVRLVGRLDPPLSRGLWLVKWVLAFPHVVVLAVLWVGFVLATVVAGFAILFTGRYPRALFQYDVSVLRWSWRVGFYAYSALGTDRYPPFSFASVDYPADLRIDRPERLSRGLVLIKWWLLAVPHYLVLAALTGGLTMLPSLPVTGGSGTSAGALPVLGVLVVVAGVVLLFTARYPIGLFDLVVGADRWAYRVAAYVSLMRDEYPPFRLDQGPDETRPGPDTPTPREDAPAHAMV